MENQTSKVSCLIEMIDCLIHQNHLSHLQHYSAFPKSAGEEQSTNDRPQQVFNGAQRF